MKKGVARCWKLVKGGKHLKRIERRPKKKMKEKTVEQLEETLAFLREELGELEARRESLEKQKAEIDEELKPIRLRLQDLKGGMYAPDRGIIQRAKAALEDARKIADRDSCC